MCIREVSDVLLKVSDGPGKVSSVFGKVSDGHSKMSDCL